MNQERLIKLLRSKPGYLKSGPSKVAQIFNVSEKVARQAIETVKVVSIPVKEERTHFNAEYAEFLKWKENLKKVKASIIIEKTKKVFPKPFNGNPDNVLVIGDLHEPFCLDGYLEFCREKQEQFNCGTVVFIGDIIDSHYSSYHESEQDTYGPNEEFDRAKDKVANWYIVFPKAYVCIGNHDRMAARKAKSAGIAERWLKDYSEALETPGWKFVMEIVINNVCYNHGEGGEAANRMKTELLSQVQGHLHSKFYIQYGVGARHKIFGMQVGCGIDRNSFAFAYGKNGPKPVIGCGVILNKGRLPILLPMDL